jgi:hypothetical protein
MRLVAALGLGLICGCATTKQTKPPDPVPPPVPIAAFAIACQTIRGPVAQSIYIVFNHRLAIHWTKATVTVMELDAAGEERDTDVGPMDIEPILKLARSATITDELKLGYGCDVMDAANPI